MHFSFYLQERNLELSLKLIKYMLLAKNKNHNSITFLVDFNICYNFY
jgi:hypothetical protein